MLQGSPVLRGWPRFMHATCSAVEGKGRAALLPTDLMFMPDMLFDVTILQSNGMTMSHMPTRQPLVNQQMEETTRSTVDAWTGSMAGTCRPRRMSLRRVASELMRKGTDARIRRRANVSRDSCVRVPAAA